MAQSIGPRLRWQWNALSSKPGGRWLFSRILGRSVPYTGSIGATVQTLESGYCVVALPDRRRVRNHLNSIHAVALCNLGEMVTGLALLHSLPDGVRGILTGLSIQYLKKARGYLTAECRCEIPETREHREYEITGEIRDPHGDVVATVAALWLTGPEADADRV